MVIASMALAHVPQVNGAGVTAASPFVQRLATTLTMNLRNAMGREYAALRSVCAVALMASAVKHAK